MAQVRRSIPASIPAFRRAEAVRRETSRARIASTGAGLRAVVGCRETHLKLVDHQQHGANPSGTGDAAGASAIRAFGPSCAPDGAQPATGAACKGSGF